LSKPVKRRRAVWTITPLLALLALSSCFGVSADISIRDDGSGRIVLEYRVSPMAGALGRLDGNRRWQTVPVGRADFERTLARLPGMRLVSFSAGEESDGADTVNRAELEFKNIETLLAFLDAPGTGASFTRENGVNRLSLTLLEAGGTGADPDLLALLREVSRPYELRLSLSAGETVSLRTAPAPVQAARVHSPGKTASLTIGTGELLSLSGGLTVEFAW
jgi:hypothetical protein